VWTVQNPYPPQEYEPAYEWNNNHDVTGDIDFFVHGEWLCQRHLQENRDYFNDTPRPGYTPYIYPHPLRNETGVNEETAPKQISAVKMVRVVPNPFVTFATIPGYEREIFSLYDATGKLVGTCRGGRIGEGLAPGVYFLKAANRDSKPLRVVKVR
jgi:hypothetical protein